MKRRGIAYAVIAASALVLSGCTGVPAPDESEVPSPPPVSLPSDSDIEEYLELSCADLVAPELARALTTGGFEAGEPQPWPAEDVTFADGVVCEWDDGNSEPTLFGWARATEDEVAAAQKHLEEQGWELSQREAQQVFVEASTGVAYVFGPDDAVRFGSTLEGADAVIAQ